MSSLKTALSKAVKSADDKKKIEKSSGVVISKKRAAVKNIGKFSI